MRVSRHRLTQRFATGGFWIWSSAAALGISLCAVFSVIALISVKGMGYFWPSPVMAIKMIPDATSSSAEIWYGEMVERDVLSTTQYREAGGDLTTLPDNTREVIRWLIKTGNRRVAPPDFRWVYMHEVDTIEVAPGVAVIERIEWGNAYGVPRALHLIDAQGGSRVITGAQLAPTLRTALGRIRALRDEMRALENGPIRDINRGLEALRLERRRLQLQHSDESAARQLSLDTQERTLRDDYEVQALLLRGLQEALGNSFLSLSTAQQQELMVPLAEITRVQFPNELTTTGKLQAFAAAIADFLTEDPREANTQGGVFPALFGTVLMVILMSIVVTPFGVLTAIYMHEYAGQGSAIRLMRIAVSNLAGVPSIVYGVFGLGFFVYLVGGNLDRLFYPEALPAPTFGTPGLMWASLTLALLTVPVVIVSTEEGLARIPMSLREGSMALGATRAETLLQVVLPITTPAIMTGVILAVARAAGEVAPLMLVGVVKLAPSLPLDGEFPFLHLDRKFMHLGFHIYDVGFQSPNTEAARPLVYATAGLLISIVVALNLTAIGLRSRLEKRYKVLEI